MGRRGKVLLFFNLGTWLGWVPNTTLRPISYVQEAGWTPGPVWTSAENLASTGIRSPDRPARGTSLHRLSCPNPQRQQATLLYLRPLYDTKIGLPTQCINVGRRIPTTHCNYFPKKMLQNSLCVTACLLLGWNWTLKCYSDKVLVSDGQHSSTAQYQVIYLTTPRFTFVKHYIHEEWVQHL